MNVIFVSKCTKASGCIDLGQPRVFALLASVLFLVCGTLLYGGYRLGSISAKSDPGLVTAALEQDLQAQREAVKEVRRQAEEQLGALSLKLGQMQAHVIRLDALGQRLTKMADLDEGEFDFENPPAQGGPESPMVPEAPPLPDFVQALDDLVRQLDDRERQLGVLENLLLTRNLEAEVYPSGRPISSGWISSYFGSRTDPIKGGKDFHNGIDFAGKRGSDVMAVAAGVVTYSGPRYGYGNMIEINHGNGYVTRYGHNEKNLVQVGDKVGKGQRIALMGSTGRSTGPHVHFEVLYDGKVVDPAKYIHASR